ncbi:MAG: 50S ribosomal protein L13 [Candidatus Neomarinimicrobiota bacterium]|nr:50S ribosomal protein L13 [Candidatus Neomarinimicrobiota bacterium]RKY44335.1 MAG: 50S ribosomal protein L13 [Candidatus Neomarinimicrobiota bacterium]RKY49779.1 MAG: 50S ribosomal protein L13 [Candidatus Neomarinimicrobiota bacterium]RKY51193.1 MAG: 50S ribosomal protein L13 [Candidatus Neomarinimicrobiota bacterium]HDN59721.1 50S ribosomal protein L13 [Candidatus Neomarinimicrobiota bacterium]
MFKTYFPKANEVKREWLLVDAEGKTLGRLASRIAYLLRGKHKPYFSPHLDTGDFVVVINAEKVRLTGKKAEQKTYFKHSGYLGGWRLVPFKEMIQKHPERVIQHAVWGMLPKNRLGRKIFKKLKVYRGNEHPHQAQNPRKIEIEG